MSEFFSLFAPSFLLRNALWGSIAVGFFCPIIGVYFLVRRMVLLGVALPQISASGIAFAFFLQGLGVAWTLHAGEPDDRFLALAGSILFTIVAILVLAGLERRGNGTTESRIGATYAMAYAAAILFVASNGTGKVEMLSMLQGEIVAVTARDLHILLAVYSLLTVVLLLFSNQFVLVSFDPQFASVMRKKVLLWDFLLYAIIGVAISVSVIIVGPMLTFAYLIVPPLAARRFCKRMGPFFVVSSLIGGIGGTIGFYCSYRLDWPLSPTNIAVISVVLLGAVGVKKGIGFGSRSRERQSLS